MNHRAAKPQPNSRHEVTKTQRRTKRNIFFVRLRALVSLWRKNVPKRSVFTGLWHRPFAGAALAALAFILPAPVAGTSAVAQPVGAFGAAADFPGGAADIVRADPASRTVRFKLPDRPGWKVWWYLRVDGAAPGETVRVEIEGDKSSAGRAVFSADRSAWRFTDPPRHEKGEGKSNATVYEAKAEGPTIWFAWYVPFVPADAEALAEKAQKSCPEAKRFELCRSEGNIPVVGVRVAGTGAIEPSRPAVWIQARQHAWEVGGSWTAAGLIEWLVSDDPRAKALRAKADVTLIPIMDVDNVARGAGGKDQKPHDHNRDWSDKPVWKAVGAAMAELKRLDAAGRLKLFLDLHDPGWGGGDVQYWCSEFAQQPPARLERSKRLIAEFQAEWAGAKDLWAFKGPHDPKYIKGLPAAGNWVRSHARDDVVAATLEIPVGPPKNFQGAPPGPHLALGRCVGLAIERFFR
jgi:hypothetical protein